MNVNSPVNVNPQQRKGSFGCLGYGCLVAALLLIVVVGGIATYILSSVRGAVDSFSAEAPANSVVAVSPDAVRSGEEKLRALARLLTEDGASGSVTFSSAELTALGQEVAGDRVVAQARGGSLVVKGSIQFARLYALVPLAKVILGARESRYMNVTCSAKLQLSSDRNLPVRVTLESLSFDGKALEGDALLQASEWFTGWASGVASEISTKGAPSRLTSLEISDDALRIGVGQ